MRLKRARLLVASVLVSQLAGVIGSIATTPSIPTWYEGLIKPVFNPPNWIFGPVWITLYTLMGISLYLVWIKGYQKPKVRKAVNLFIVHLAVNSLWSIVFFGLHYLGLALLTVVVLWILIAYLIKIFWDIEKRASQLLLPYLLWVSFASLLNLSIWLLN